MQKVTNCIQFKLVTIGISDVGGSFYSVTRQSQTSDSAPAPFALGLVRYSSPTSSRRGCNQLSNSRCVTCSACHYTAHYGKMWRHPQNRKYISYRSANRGGPSHDHGEHEEKNYEDRAKGSGDILENRQTDKQTDALITILCSPTGAEQILMCERSSSENHNQSIVVGAYWKNACSFSV